MRTRLIIVAAVAFALGAAVDRFARITGYDTVIATTQQRLETQQQFIETLQAERAQIDAVLRERQALEKSFQTMLQKMEVDGAVTEARYKAALKLLQDSDATIGKQAEELRRLKDERSE